MSFTTTIKDILNSGLGVFGLCLDTLTEQKAEAARIDSLKRAGHFERPAFPLLPGMEEFSVEPMANLAKKYKRELGMLMSGGTEPGAYQPDNSFYESPDAEILYLMVRALQPTRIVEIGCGNSTRVVRQAIHDGDLSVAHTAIDPCPRSDIVGLVDEMILERLEDVSDIQFWGSLGEDDVLFVDSSHEVRIGNDVARIFCDILPALAPGVVVHVHDIFLPFDYQEPYPTQYSGWGEQYLLQALLQGKEYELIWPGFYMQKSRPDEYAAGGFSEKTCIEFLV